MPFTIEQLADAILENDDFGSHEARDVFKACQELLKGTKEDEVIMEFLNLLS